MRFLGVLILLVLPDLSFGQKNPAWPWRSQGPEYGKMSGKDKRDVDRAVRETMPPPAKTCSLPPDKPAKLLPLVSGRVRELEFVEPWPAETPVNLRLQDLRPVDSVRILFPQQRRWGATYKGDFAAGRPTSIWGPDENYSPSAEKALSFIDGEVALSECVNGAMSQPLGVFPPLPKSSDRNPPAGIMPRCEGTCRYLEPVMHDGERKHVLVRHSRLNQLWWLAVGPGPGLAGVTRIETGCSRLRPGSVDFEFELGDSSPEYTLPGLKPQSWSVRCLQPGYEFGYSLAAIGRR